MGAHHARTATIAPLTGVAGRGVLTASAALALTGASTGAAFAHDTHGSEHEVSESQGSDGQASPFCDVFGEGDLFDVGLDTDSAGDLCFPDDEGSDDPQSSEHGGHEGHGSSEDDGFWDDHGDDGSSSSNSTPTSAPPAPASSPARPAAAKPAAKPAFVPANPQDVPPAPGQTKTLQIPARTTS